MKLSNLSIKSKLISIVILSVVLLVMASSFNLMQQRDSSMQERQDKLSAQVETAVSLASYYYSQRNVLG
ncbi:methyl-accepting chemotaxis protein, partial [Vibrio breoganii]